MKKVHVVFFVLFGMVAAGCGGADKDGEKPNPKPVPDVTFASIGGDKWPVGEAGISFDGLPRAPVGYTDYDVLDMADIIIDWAKAATLDERVFHSDSPEAIVGATLPPYTRSRVIDDFNKQTSPRISAANVFGDGVTIVGQPRVTSEWKVTTTNEEGVNIPLLHVSLQTRAAFEVTGTTKGKRVIGIVRNFGLNSYGPNSAAGEYGNLWRIRISGVKGCSLAVEDAVVPLANAKNNHKKLDGFAALAGSDDFDDLDENEQSGKINEDLKKRCLDGAA